VFLIAVGTFSLLTFSARKRLTEIGIRLALGAQPRQVVTLLLRQSGLLIAVGLAFGLVGALVAGQLIRAMLFGVEPTDWVAYALAGTVIVTSGLAASVAPALKARRTDPAVLLRHDAG
jgi:putative ABC transport system permease protein